MTNKEIFIKEVEDTIKDCPDFFSLEALEYFQTLKATEEKPAFTENGARVLQWMKDNEDHYNNIFKAKEIAEGLFLPSSRSVSGSLRKLINDGYAEKMGANPICYALTTKGRECLIPTPEVEDN